MATYVLVHGGRVSAYTWNDLTNTNDYPSGTYLGGNCWKYNVLALKQQGHKVFAPDLKDENIYNLSDHIEQICSLIVAEDLDEIILVGHSYGGMVITGVAAKMPNKIRKLVYLDAAFPDSGQSLFDILTTAGFEPEKVVSSNPPAYTQKLLYNPKMLKPISKVYILCTESEFFLVTSMIIKKIDFNEIEWSYFELPTNHLPQASMPDELNRILLNLSIGL